MMPRKKEIVCSTLAFYGLRAPSSGTVAIIEALSKWFQARSCPIDKIAVTGTGWSGKAISFEKALPRIRQDPSNITEFSIFSLLPGPVDYMLNSKLQAEFCFSEGENGWATIEARPGVADIPGEEALEIAAEVISAFTPQYGIGFRMLLSKGPSFYGMAVPYRPDLSKEGREEMMKIQNWRRVGMRKQAYKQGLLRGIYAWNFLNRSQLNAKVGDNDLATWIKADADRGKTIPMKNELVLWEVDVTQIPAVAKHLDSAGVIFNETED